MVYAFSDILLYIPHIRTHKIVFPVLLQQSASKLHRENFLKEIETMATLLHPNVVKMYGVVEYPESDVYHVVLEYLHLGDLKTYLQKKTVSHFEDYVL